MNQTGVIDPDTLKDFWFKVATDPIGKYYIHLPIFKVKGASHNMYFYREGAPKVTIVKARGTKNGKHKLFLVDNPLWMLAHEEFAIDRMTVSEWCYECNGMEYSRWYIDEMDITFREPDYLPQKGEKGMNKELSEKQQRYYIGKAARILRDVVFFGGTDEEVERAVKYSRDIIELCKTNRETIREAEVKYRVKELQKKYCRPAANRKEKIMYLAGRTNYEKHAVGALWAFVMLKDHIDFLKDFDPVTAVGICEPQERISYMKQRTIVGKAARTLYSAMESGAPEDEIKRIARYGLVAIDCVKHQLDMKQAEEKYSFRALYEKYVKKSRNV